MGDEVELSVSHDPFTCTKRKPEMELIERYLYVATRRLPEEQREDVARELRTTIEDMAADMAGSRPAEETHIAAALESLGDPQVLADRYAHKGRYLIGPDWYDTYLKTLQRTLYIALPAFAVITLVVQLAVNPGDVNEAISRAIGGAINVGLQVLFWVTLVFAGLERSASQPGDLHGKRRAWTADQLPKLPGPRQISFSEALTDIVTDLTAAGLIAVPFIMAAVRGDTDFVPLLNPALWQGWLPLFLVILGLTLIHDFFKLRIGNWTPVMTVTNVILGLASIAFLAALVFTQEVINPAHLLAVAGSKLPAEAREAARWTVGITAACIIIAYIYSIVNSIILARRLGKSR
jgi:hypothetical protein